MPPTVGLLAVFYRPMQYPSLCVRRDGIPLKMTPWNYLKYRFQIHALRIDTFVILYQLSKNEAWLATYLFTVTDRTWWANIPRRVAPSFRSWYRHRFGLSLCNAIVQNSKILKPLEVLQDGLVRSQNLEIRSLTRREVHESIVQSGSE